MGEACDLKKRWTEAESQGRELWSGGGTRPHTTPPRGQAAQVTYAHSY